MSPRARRRLRTAAPRALPRATARVLACVVLLAPLGLGQLAAAEEELEDKKVTVDQDLNRSRERLAESRAAVAAATTALLQAQADLSQAQAYLAQTRGELAAAEALDQQMQRKLDAAVARLAAARRELAAGRADMRAQEDELRQMVASTYEHGDPALMGLSVVFTSQDPTQLAGTMSATSSVVNVESKILDQLEAAKVMLQVREEETEAAKQEVAKRRQAAAENLAHKQALTLQAESAEQQVSALVGLRAQARDNALRARETDLADLAALQVERDRIEELIAEQASRGAGYTGPVNGNGFLDPPVEGRITSPYGWRIHPIWGYRSLHDGIDYGAACGTEIRATAAGKVLSVYYQRAYGNRVIIDHGVHHGVGVATISNHLSAYTVATGDRVKRGDVIGYVGNTGWSTGCHLHFTVLENGTAADPMRWF